MQKSLIIILLLALAFAGAWFLSVRQDQKVIEQVEVAPPPPVDTEPAAAEPPQIIYPVESIHIEPPPVPLPALEESDAEVTGQLEALFGAEALERYFLSDRLISRLVATVDSLTSARVAPLMLPVRPVEGRFAVLGTVDEAVISPQNAQRYDAYAGLVAGLDTERTASLYRRYYPLLQESYQELGYPDASFNDRLVEVIDHLLATPEPQGMLGLVQNEAVYEFQNPDLEALSAGQKVLLRMGNDHARIVKDKLRAFQTAIRETPVQ